MGGHKARVYYDLEDMPHTWVRLTTPDGTQETRGFAPTVFSPVWKGRVKDDARHEWTMYREYDITEAQYNDMKKVVEDWSDKDLSYIFGQRDCRDLVHEVMEKRGGYDGAMEHGFNSQAQIGFTVEGSLSIFKELSRDQGLVNDLAEKIRSQGNPGRLLGAAEIQEAFDSGYWPGPYGPEDDNRYGPPGM